MTREEIMNLDIEQIESRTSSILDELKDADAEGINAINEELSAIEERKAQIKAEIEQRKADIEEVIKGAGDVIEEPIEERKNTMEIRESNEYLNAWVEYMKGRATQEQRTLLTENSSDGTIPIPAAVEQKVQTAWESNEIMKRIRKSYFKGNLKVPYEESAAGAVLHDEGGSAISEENLVVNFVNLIPTTLKKMVKYSTEILDMAGQTFVDYVFDEIEYQIVKTAGNIAVGKMASSSITESYTAAGASLTAADVVNAEGALGGEASNPVLITSRAAAAALKAAALSAGYGYDPFDGMDVVYVDASFLTSVNVLGVVADLSGVQANFPNGDTPTFVFDEYTEAAADIVRVIGRMMIGIDVVAPGKIVKIVAGA